jgi:hypothetical protein
MSTSRHLETTATIQYLLNTLMNKHTPLHNKMQVLHYQKKSTHLNTVERYYIHTEFTANNHLNDSQNIFSNAIFDAILKTHQQQ